MRKYDLIKSASRAAANRWPDVLALIGIDVPDNHRAQVSCPACGGKDRFRFDDNGRGSHFCNQCGAGDGLDLIQKVKRCSAFEAAQKVASVLGVDTRSAPEASNSAPTVADGQPTKPIAERVTALLAKARPGVSAYLTNKGLNCPPLPILPDGSLVLPLRLMDGTLTGAQLIRQDGGKKLLAGTQKRGAFIALGDLPEQAERVMIAEGYATAQSVALLTPDAVHLAALDAGNLLRVAEAARARWPNANITIAADNDWHAPGELDEHGKPKRNTGKLSAEKAATAVSGWVASPPTDHPADWDDYRQQNGLEAATAAFDGSMYHPEGRRVKTQLNVIEGEKPRTLSEKDDLKPYFDIRHGRLCYIEPKLNKDTGEINETLSLMADEMEAVGVGSDGKDGYLVVRMRPEGANTVLYEAIPRREIGTPQGWARLRSRGINITAKRGHLDLLAHHLQFFGGREEWTITHTAGWHNGAYVMPDGHIIGSPSRPVAFCGGTSAVAGYVVRGTVEGWRNNVASLMRGNQSMVLGALVAFAAPLNALAGGGSFGVHLFAQSSAGKTTTVEAASSIYGVPDELKLTWDATKYGLTVEAASRNDGFMPIDEIGQGNDVRHVAGSAYSLFNGTGRVQGHKDGGNKAVLRWAIVALSTGEEDFETYLLRNGVTPKAGQLVRLLSVPFIDTTDFHDLDDGDQHARAIKRASQQHCGAVGRAWIEILAADREAACQKVTKKENRWLASLPADLSPQAKRVAVRFALLDAAAELSAPLTGWTPAESSAHIRASFDEWLENYGTGNREKYQVASRAKDFIQRYGLSRFQPYTYGKKNGDMDRAHAARITQLAGYLVSGRREDGRNEYHIIPSVFEAEILCGIQKKLGADALDEAGMLVRPEAGRIDGKTISVNGEQQRFIVLVGEGGE